MYQEPWFIFLNPIDLILKERPTHPLLAGFLTQTRQPAFCNTLTDTWHSSQSKRAANDFAAHLTADDSPTAFSCSTRDQKINSIDKLRKKTDPSGPAKNHYNHHGRVEAVCTLCLPTASRLVTCRCAMDCAKTQTELRRKYQCACDQPTFSLSNSLHLDLSGFPLIRFPGAYLTDWCCYLKFLHPSVFKWGSASDGTLRF